ncbi:MAG TPA: hypothetical protein VGM44_22435 [Polyangiaceae bacterium]|jgi:hypothetical protein
MIKRLIDDPCVEATEERLADLFRAATPYEADPFRKRRVLVSMSRVEARRVPRFWLRPAVIAILLVSGTATAAIGHRYVAHGSGFFGFGSAAPAAATVTGAVALVPASKTALNAAAQPSTDSTDPDTAAPADAPLTTDSAEPTPTTHAAPKGSSHARPDSSEDASHVALAIQALRTDKDPSRAQGLLNDYLTAHPNGVLSEDALALSIEAASARHDPKAADFARRYLAKFPHGKYRDLANRAIAQQQ